MIDLSGLTLNPKEALQPSEAVFEATYVKPSITEAHEVRQGIQMKSQIPFYGLLGLVGKADTGCGANDATNTVGTSQKYWEPKMVGFRLAHCQADVEQLYKMWAKDMVAANQWEKIPNPQIQFLSGLVADATEESILRLAEFGDTEAETFDNAGVLTNGTDKTYFNVIDGTWKQIFTGVTAGDILKIPIAENAEATKVAQLDLDASTAFDTFAAMLDQADPRLLEQKGLFFQVTRTMATNYRRYLESKNLSAGFLERTENGTPKLMFNGIPILVRYDWDRTITAYMDNGTTYDKPSRAILTVAKNIPIGTSDEGSMKSMQMFYDKKERTHYIDVDYMIDVKLLEEYLTVVAY